MIHQLTHINVWQVAFANDVVFGEVAHLPHASEETALEQGLVGTLSDHVIREVSHKYPYDLLRQHPYHGGPYVSS